MWLVLAMSAASTLVTVGILWPLRDPLCELVTSDAPTHDAAAPLVAAAFVGAGLSQLVNILTSGVLSGQVCMQSHRNLSRMHEISTCTSRMQPPTASLRLPPACRGARL